MNIQKLKQGKRRAISPVLATVILIAITLIAAIAIAGFVFGLFGSFTSTARVQASVGSCVASSVANQEDCTLILTNSGNANTQTTGTCSVSYGGTTKTGVSSNVNNPVAAVVQTITAGGPSVTVYCNTVGAAAAATAGSQVTGSVILSNGGNALFSTTAS